MKKTRKILLLLLILTPFLVGLGIGAGAYHMKVPHEFWDRLLPIPHDELKVVVIKPGLNARQCAQAFYDQEALSGHPGDLARWMTRLGIDRSIRPGQYRVVKSDAWNMARQLLTVQPISSSLTIIPGMDVFSMRDIFDAEQNPASPASGDLLSVSLLNDQCYPEPLRQFLPEDEESRIAFLLPETYFVAEESPEELVRIASHAWWDLYEDRLSADITPEALKRKAVSASMIQREALWDADRPVIAGVIENRLERDMPLQIDATVIYAWKLKGRNLTRVLHSDLTVDSPYNTYAVQGLPPAPICIPSAESWEAALAPEDNSYYYYVARKDGYHYFAENYAEHRQNIRKARE